MTVITLEELFKSSPRREIQSPKKVVKNHNTPFLERLAKNGDVTSRVTENGTTKMKILVKKQDLKQMLEAMNVVVTTDKNQCTATTTTTRPPATTLSSIERRLHGLMKRRRASRLQQQQTACRGQHLSSWRPALQSIPEESY